MEPIAGDNRARLCRRCNKPVYDSKSMTRDELHALIEKTEGAPPCLQLHLRPDGTVVTKGCLSALYRTSRFLWVKAAALAVAFWSAVVGLRRACDTAAMAPVSIELEPQNVPTVMGFVKIVPEPRRPPAHKPNPTRAEIDREPPLRHLEVEEDLMPEGWRDSLPASQILY